MVVVPHDAQIETVMDEDIVMGETGIEDNITKIDDFSISIEKLPTSNSIVTSSTTQSGGPMDSPCNPSSSSIDRGIDPLNLLDQEFLSSKDPREWSVQEVMDFMTAIGCPAHAPSFQKQVSTRSEFSIQVSMVICVHSCYCF